MASAPPVSRPFASPAERGSTLGHDFDAPAWLVYQAFTRPELVRRWWDTSSMTTVCQADVREGGRFVYASRTFNGGSVRHEGAYRLIVPDERLVFTLGNGHEVGSALTTVTFFEIGGITRLTSTFCYASQPIRDQAIASGVEVGWAERFERLASLLTALL